MTFAELRGSVTYLIDPSYYAQAEIDAAINEGQRLTALLTLCVEVDGTVPITPSIFYQLLTILPSFFAPLRIEYDGVRLERKPSLASIASRNPMVFGSVSPGAARRYCLTGADLLTIDPKPTNGSLSIRFAEIPGDMDEPSDVSAIPDPWAQELAGFAAYRLSACREGLPQAGEAMAGWKRWRAMLADLSRHTRERFRVERFDSLPIEITSKSLTKMLDGLAVEEKKAVAHG